jgi:hypothetical protein
MESGTSSLVHKIGKNEYLLMDTAFPTVASLMEFSKEARKFGVIRQGIKEVSRVSVMGWSSLRHVICSFLVPLDKIQAFQELDEKYS